MRAGRLMPLLFAAGCFEVARGKSAADLDVRDIRADMPLQSACTPTGIELCFDAYDNNCNGVIDEGCGLQTGILQFTIAWSEPCDVDLRVVGPSGNPAPLDEPSEDGLMKDRDCKGEGDACHGQNVENVFLAEGWPKRGRYQVEVRLADPRDTSGPIKVRLSARIGQRHVTSLLSLKGKDDARKFEFSL